MAAGGAGARSLRARHRPGLMSGMTSPPDRETGPGWWALIIGFHRPAVHSTVSVRLLPAGWTGISDLGCSPAGGLPAGPLIGGPPSTARGLAITPAGDQIRVARGRLARRRRCDRGAAATTTATAAAITGGEGDGGAGVLERSAQDVPLGRDDARG